MAKSVHSTILNFWLSYVQGSVVRVWVLSGVSGWGTPSSALASTTITSAEMVIGAGSVSGRRLLISARATISVLMTGSADHIALGASTSILYYTTCTSQALTSGNTVTVPIWYIEIADPT